ncbi:MAG: Uma2 family endonuclease, partial [Caldilineaceae bacterium]|nr:Uma2 family endonuclease [Caldilineaceae bacterium]
IDVSYEWNNGRLEAKPLPNHPQIRQYRWFSRLLDCYVQVNPIAKFIDLETGVSMTVLDSGEPSGKWEVVYKPDLGVVLNDNPAPWGAVELRAFEGVCDMIVEEVSDSTLAEVRRDTEEKRRGYALAGVKEYFILDPADRYMGFYRLTGGRRYAEIRPDAAGVIGSQVLPGFQFRRTDLLNLPDLEALALDEVYAGYVIPGFHDAVNRVEEAEERAEAEAAARRHVEEQLQAARAEIARLRQDRA